MGVWKRFIGPCVVIPSLPLSQWGQGLNRALLVSEAALEAAPEASSHTICPSAYFFNRKKKEVYETDSGLLLL